MKLPLTGDTEADTLLEKDPLALLIGMLLDQQVPMEKAFRGPYDLRERMGGRLHAGEIASFEMGHFSVADIHGPEALAAVREHKKAMKAAVKAAK